MIHFVGAGPGAVDLVTVRGAKLLETADVVIYAGSLVNEELLSYCKSGCKFYNSAEMTLDEAVGIMNENRNSEVVRLHTGDPSIYGAIREQIDRLGALGIEFDITPGVSSFCAAAASLKAEYTLPNVSQSVTITRMAGKTPVPERESIRSFAAHKATMLVFLSAGMTEKLQEELLLGGYEKDTPCAIVYKASWDDEEIVHCAVGTLHNSVTQSGIKNHALICVGNFLGGDYELSKLYDPAFTTAFREGKANDN
jgi:precorrin-4/cobalt-precorrin-4 C11-methyltransferase